MNSQWRYGVCLLVITSVCLAAGCSENTLSATQASPSRESAKSVPADNVQAPVAVRPASPSQVEDRDGELVAILRRMEERQATSLEEQRLYRTELMALLLEMRGLMEAGNEQGANK